MLISFISIFLHINDSMKYTDEYSWLLLTGAPGDTLLWISAHSEGLQKTAVKPQRKQLFLFRISLNLKQIRSVIFGVWTVSGSLSQRRLLGPCIMLSQHCNLASILLSHAAVTSQVLPCS